MSERKEKQSEKIMRTDRKPQLNDEKSPHCFKTT